MATALADHLGQLALAVTEFVDQPAVTGGLFKRRQIGALDVLHQTDFESLAVRQGVDHDRHVVDLGDLGGAPPAFAGDDLVRTGSSAIGTNN